MPKKGFPCPIKFSGYFIKYFTKRWNTNDNIAKSRIFSLVLRLAQISHRFEWFSFLQCFYVAKQGTVFFFAPKMPI